MPLSRAELATDDPALSQRVLRRRRRRKRAYIRSVYFLPSMATLGNAICGFGAIYVCHLHSADAGDDPWTRGFADHRFLVACYLILLAMLFDALDGRLARWARHTTDFGGQLDSMADVLSFGAAPAMIALALFKADVPNSPLFVGRLVWMIGAIYVSCAAIRLARFNVSNEHGEQAHMSFLGLPSPGAAAAVIGAVLIHQELRETQAAVAAGGSLAHLSAGLASTVVYLLPVITLAAGLLMVSAFRYPHLVNKYLRGRHKIGRLIGMLLFALLLVAFHRYTIGVAAITYAIGTPLYYLWLRRRGPRRLVDPHPAVNGRVMPSITNFAAVRILVAFLAAAVVSLMIRFGSDFEAWGIQAHFLDSLLCSLIVLCIPVALLLDYGITKVGMKHPLIRLAVVALAGCCVGFAAITDVQGIDYVIGTSPPAGVRVLSSRDFTTIAGGGEEYVYVQFELDPLPFEKWMTTAGFSPDPDPMLPLDDQYNRDKLFRFPIQPAAYAIIYTKSFSRTDEATVVWDPQRHLAHAKRIRG